MKRYLNGLEFFKNHLAPKREDKMSWNNFNTGSQSKLSSFIDALPGISIEGDISDIEMEIIQQIKSEIEGLKNTHSDIRPDRLDIDIAIIFHRNLKKLKWGKYQIDDFGLWRWLSSNHFLSEVRWRWAIDDPKLEKLFENSKACYQRLIGERNRRIFPLWYFTIGERLYDGHFGYSLLEKLAISARKGSAGGFGNLNNNLNDTKILSPNDYAAKTMSKLLLAGSIIAGNDEVANAFKRYNAYKRRLLNYASESIFEKEICLFQVKKAS